MQIRKSIIIPFLFLFSGLLAQNTGKQVLPPTIDDFAPSLNFLASSWMEGREAGEKGGFMAADYMATMMQSYKLSPVRNITDIHRINEKLSYYQDFELIKYKIENSSLALINQSANSKSKLELIDRIEYDAIGGHNSNSAEAPLVFAGYGINSPETGYNDFKNIDVAGKIILILQGFPGDNDKNSIAWKKFNNYFADDDELFDKKQKDALNRGALGLIVINTKIQKDHFSFSNTEVLKLAKNQQNTNNDSYVDSDYKLLQDIHDSSLPTFFIKSNSVKRIEIFTGINFSEYEKSASELNFSNIKMRNKVIYFSIKVKSEVTLVRNVIGMIPGKDSTKFVIVGGHYDHLGKSQEEVCFGADDNASGASGVLALAKQWAKSGIVPSCNIIFASWTAEEKGLLGSRYFVQSVIKDQKNVILYLNLDMISRSETDDTNHLKLSIGTRTADKYLREFMQKSNRELKNPFVLDLWDVTGHWGSDYASFTEQDIPVMTFNTGLHDDYHTPKDITTLVDLYKMEEVLKLVHSWMLQNCIEESAK